MEQNRTHTGTDADPDDAVRRGAEFRRLHEEGVPFIIPNPWDAGSAKILAAKGFKALATTSIGHAFSLGQLDNTLTREQTLANAADIVAATDLPVSADLEDGFGEDPDTVADTIRLAAGVGLVGGSIEDATGNPDAPLHDFSKAVDRVAAAVQAARAAGHDFVLTARCENFLWSKPDLDDTIARLQAYQEAGADVLYAPGLTTREQLAAVVSSVDRPVNAVMGLAGANLPLAVLAELGVRRISLGSSLQRSALAALDRAADEMLDHGTFDFTESAMKPAMVGERFGSLR